MELAEVLARRRMVRAYTDRPVERATVERVLDAARRGPSAGFSQGLRFVVVTSSAGRARLAELAGEPAEVARGRTPWLSSAPVHVVVCADEGAYRRRYAEADKDPAVLDGPVPYWWVDAGGALVLLLLAAVDEGLGGGFLGAHAMPDLGPALDLPGDVHPLGVVTLGHAAGEQPTGSAARGWRGLDELVTWRSD